MPFTESSPKKSKGAPGNKSASSSAGHSRPTTPAGEDNDSNLDRKSGAAPEVCVNLISMIVEHDMVSSSNQTKHLNLLAFLASLLLIHLVASHVESVSVCRCVRLQLSLGYCIAPINSSFESILSPTTFHFKTIMVLTISIYSEDVPHNIW